MLSGWGRASHRHLAAEWSPTALATVDRRGVTTFLNAALRRMLPGARVGATAAATLAEADGAGSLAAALAEVLRQTAARPVTIEIVRSGAPAATWRYVLAPLPTSSGAVGGVVIAVQDVTATTGMGEQLAAAHRLQAVGQMAGGLAHDFNNLLTAILAAAESLAAADLDPTGAEDVKTIREAGERGAALIGKLLSIGRQDALQPRVLDAAASVGAFARVVRRSLPEGVRIQTDLEPGGLPVEIDPTALDRIILNLAVNAGQVMPERGTVTLRAVRTTLVRPLAAGHERVPAGMWAEVTVEDDGPGMPPEVVASIFQPFFTTRRSSGGTGLGLATVQGLARQSGGYVIADSAVGRGTRMRVLLPLAAGQATQARHAAAEPPPPVAAAHACTILFVDDEDGVRRVMTRALKRAGFIMLDAPDAEAAMAVVGSAGLPDAIVTDMMMPGRTGDDLVRDLRQQAPGLPAVLASGYAEKGMPADLLTQPRTAWLAKPYSVAQLTATLATLSIVPPQEAH